MPHQTEKERNGFQETGDPQGSYEGSTPEDTCAANLVSSWSRLEVIRGSQRDFFKKKNLLGYLMCLHVLREGYTTGRRVWLQICNKIENQSKKKKRDNFKIQANKFNNKRKSNRSTQYDKTVNSIYIVIITNSECGCDQNRSINSIGKMERRKCVKRRVRWKVGLP